MDVDSKILKILLDNRHVGRRTSIRHTVIAYTYHNKQLHWALNSYNTCCSTSKHAGHYYDHAETKLLNAIKFVPKTVYIIGITQGKRIMTNTLPCQKCMNLLQKKGIRNVVCLYKSSVIKIKI